MNDTNVSNSPKTPSVGARISNSSPEPLPQAFDSHDFRLRLTCDVCTSYEPDDAITDYSGEIVAYGDHGDQMIGKIALRVVDLDASQDSVFDVLDCVDQETADHLVLFDADGQFSPAVGRVLDEEDTPSTNLLLIDRIEILPQARGRGLAPLILNLLSRKFRNTCRLAVLKPFPLQYGSAFERHKNTWEERMGYKHFDADQKKALRKLKKLYRTAGFVPVPRTDYMVRDLYEQ